MLHLRLTQMPRCPDLSIFVLADDDRQTDTTDYITPCECARDNDSHAVWCDSPLHVAITQQKVNYNH